jgi:hypothetical protein
MSIQRVRRVVFLTAVTGTVVALAQGAAVAGLRMAVGGVLVEAAAGVPTPTTEAPEALPGWDDPDAAPVLTALPVVDLPTAAVVFHLAASRGGPTVVTAVTMPDGTSEPYASASTLPFSYTADWYAALRGRDMKTTSTIFCNDYHSTSVENAAADPYTEIQLVLNIDNGPDKYYERVRYQNDGVPRGWCWRGHSSLRTYHFDYRQPDTYWRVQAAGTVDGS